MPRKPSKPIGRAQAVSSPAIPPSATRPVRQRAAPAPTEIRPEPPRPAAPVKPGLHPRNRHQGRYDFSALIAVHPELARFVAPNAYGDTSIDFADPAAVRALNAALLAWQYGIRGWRLPAPYLCPPIPGRADYLHHLADLLAESLGDVPRGAAVRVLDVGVGANCIYPLIGHSEYGWSFVGSDVERGALANAQQILDANPGHRAAVELRLQSRRDALFAGLVRPGERFALTLCNPPFHASAAEASAGSARKWAQLGKAEASPRGHAVPRLNFGGQDAELFCAGGEAGFLTRMIAESAARPEAALWFTALVSKAANLPALERALQTAGVRQRRTVAMAQGQKQSRFIAWSFLAPAQLRDALRATCLRSTP
ncbi:MAG: 23S rRNA (adenine(1618)-N(6))-methyltransferase RlmF [Propionivibrio sp.]